MAESELRHHAEHFLATAREHAQCRGGQIAEVTDEEARLQIELDVELPLHMKEDGVSPTGVRSVEPANVVLEADYPWSSPTFYLRPDFPRDLPHLQPDPPGTPPRPCLVDGDQREYFLQFGLVEAGIWHLLQQLVRWLGHAATQSLINRDQGWEPTLRRGLDNWVQLDADFCRSWVDRRGGRQVFKAQFYRLGPPDGTFSDRATAMVNVTREPAYLNRRNQGLLSSGAHYQGSWGNTIAGLIWSDKHPDGEPFIADRYMPETVSSLGELHQRANEVGCGQQLHEFLQSLRRCFGRHILDAPVPIAVILCARRPHVLMGTASYIELLPYVVEIRLERARRSMFAGGDAEPVAPANQFEVANPALLRQVSGAPQVGPVALLGCGSVGSKMALHLARSGIELSLLSDRGVLQPHNLARHALARPPLAGTKAQALAEELTELGQYPEVREEDLMSEIGACNGWQALQPKSTSYAVNTTASLGVREALSALPSQPDHPRLVEAALFGRGQGGFLLVEGQDHNPTLHDLTAELYGSVNDERLRQLLFDPDSGLSEVQIGQGCGSLTMPMTDPRLSALTANLTEHLMAVMEEEPTQGRIIVGYTGKETVNTSWFHESVPPFKVLPIESSTGWTLRVPQRVLDTLRTEMGEHPNVETGGVLIGTCNARLKVFTVVDTLPAPRDSNRTVDRFVLGTNGLQAMIQRRHEASGGTLFDVGTWHSHLSDQGPSSRDRDTARVLTTERPLPAVLLIATPQGYHAVMHEPLS